MFFDILLISTFVIILTYFISQRKSADSPPGPYGIPILGNLLQLGQAPFLLFQNEWKEKYGPIISIYFGSYSTVAISDYKLIRKALQDPAFSGRPDMELFHQRADDVVARGIIFTDGVENIAQRRFTSKHLKEFGYVSKTLETVIVDEILEMTDVIAKAEGHPISVKERFHLYTLNILWFIVAGRKCEDDRARLSEIFSNCTRIIEKNNMFSALCMFIPWFAKYFPTLSGFKYMNKELVPLRSFLKKHIDEHKVAQEKQPDAQHDLIGAYLNEIIKSTDPSSSFYKEVGERSLTTSLIDLFFAGTETTANTTHWACLYLATNPGVEEKLFEEIDRVVGKSRLPSLDDESNMLYTQAFIQEILRLTSITPLSVFHNTLENVEFEGYKIPKDTMILFNLHGAHHDKQYWGDPYVLRPERFLSPDGTGLVKHEAFFPFSLGRRKCIGEGLARNELFLYITAMVQRFEIKPDPGDPHPDMEPNVTFVLLPKNSKLVFSPRPGFQALKSL